MDINYSDTICAPATSVGSGAISIVRLSGPRSLQIVDSIVSFKRGNASESSGYTLKYGSVDGLDDVVVALYRAPHSFTGEDAAEISCHASSWIVGSLLDMLVQAGCRLAEHGEFTRRAFVNGKMDLAQAEAVADVIASTTAAQHRVAMNQLRGGYSAELAGIRSRLLELSALLELELDFSEEDVEFADRGRLLSLAQAALRRCKELADSFRVGNALRNGVPVAIVGAPNGGKSTLLNALLQDERALVSNVPGTTRDTVEECCHLGGMLLRFIDTAGLRETGDEVERMGISRSMRKLREAEIVLLVVDPLNDYAGSMSDQVRAVADEMDPAWQKLVVLVNKMDLLAPNKNVLDNYAIISYLDNKKFAYRLLGISAQTGEGLEELRSALVSFAGTLPEDGILVTNARHAEALSRSAEALAELIRGLGASALTADLLAEDLREAIRSLGTITGEITTDETLGVIFERFCIGK